MEEEGFPTQCSKFWSQAANSPALKPSPSDKDGWYVSLFDIGSSQRFDPPDQRHLVTGSSFFKNSVHGRIARALGERILTGELTPGSVLPPEEELSRRLGISRSALREAFKLLVAKGLIESRPKIGTRVRPRVSWNLLDPDVLDWQAANNRNAGFLAKLLELRLMVEPAAAKLAATRCRPDDLRRMSRAIEAFQSAEMADGREAALAEFRRAVLDATQNDLLGGLHMLARNTLLPANAERSAQILDLCHKLLKAFTDQDEDQAEITMRRLVLFCESNSDSNS